MPNSLNASGRLTKERIPLVHAMYLATRPCQVRRGVGEGRGGVDLALNSLLRAIKSQAAPVM